MLIWLFFFRPYLLSEHFEKQYLFEGVCYEVQVIWLSCEVICGAFVFSVPPTVHLTGGYVAPSVSLSKNKC